MIQWGKTTIAVGTGSKNVTYTLDVAFQQYYVPNGTWDGGRVSYATFDTISKANCYVGTGTGSATRAFVIICFGF